MQRLQTPEGEKKTAILITEPKSQCSIRDIPIAGTLREKLMQQTVKEGYVLTGNKNKYVEPRTMQNHFKAIVEVRDLLPVGEKDPDLPRIPYLRQNQRSGTGAHEHPSQCIWRALFAGL